MPLPIVAMPLFLKSTGKFLKGLPWWIYAGAVLIIITLFARSYWIGVGVERCEIKQEEAQKKALAESIVQELNAPAIAQKAQDKVKPQVIERTRIIREQIKSMECGDVAYPDGVQQAVREAAAAANRMR